MCVYVSVSGVLFSVGVCVYDLLICPQPLNPQGWDLLRLFKIVRVSRVWRIAITGWLLHGGLYTILPLPILYGAWHTREKSKRKHTLRDNVCGQHTGGRNKRGVSGS